MAGRKEKMKARDIVALIVGVPSFIWFGYTTSVEAAIALFLLLFANNLSQQQFIIDKTNIVNEVIDDIIQKYFKN